MLMFSRVLLPTRCQVEGMRLQLWSEDRLLKPAREFEERDFSLELYWKRDWRDWRTLDYEHNHRLVYNPHEMPIERNLLE